MTTQSSQGRDLFEVIGIWTACVAGTFLVLFTAKLGSVVGTVLLNIDQVLMQIGIDSFFTAFGITFVVILITVRIGVEAFIRLGRRLCR